MSCRNLALALVLVVCPWLPQPGVTAELAADAVTSVANGSIALSAKQHSPLFAEFDRSSTLSKRLHESLLAMGFVLTQDKSTARAILLFRGDLALVGGPVFYKGVKVPVGDATEKTLQGAKDGDGVSRAEVVQAVAAWQSTGRRWTQPSRPSGRAWLCQGWPRRLVTPPESKAASTQPSPGTRGAFVLADVKTGRRSARPCICRSRCRMPPPSRRSGS